MPRKIITILALLGLGAGLGAAPYKVQANAAREQAIHLRDQGRAAEAAGLIKAQATQLKAAASALPPAENWVLNP